MIEVIQYKEYQKDERTWIVEYQTIQGNYKRKTFFSKDKQDRFIQKLQVVVKQKVIDV